MLEFGFVKIILMQLSCVPRSGRERLVESRFVLVRVCGGRLIVGTLSVHHPRCISVTSEESSSATASARSSGLCLAVIPEGTGPSADAGVVPNGIQP